MKYIKSSLAILASLTLSICLSVSSKAETEKLDELILNWKSAILFKFPSKKNMGAQFVKCLLGNRDRSIESSAEVYVKTGDDDDYSNNREFLVIHVSDDLVSDGKSKISSKCYSLFVDADGKRFFTTRNGKIYLDEVERKLKKAH